MGVNVRKSVKLCQEYNERGIRKKNDDVNGRYLTARRT